MHDVLLAGVLGAAVLAIVLLHRAQQKQTELITQLRAEVTAQRIAAITGRPTPLAEDEDQLQEPVRRKRHLALYIGGGVAAVLASLGRRLRSALRPSPRTAVMATATVAAVATTAAALIMSSSDSTPGPPDHNEATAPEREKAPEDADERPAIEPADTEDETLTDMTSLDAGHASHLPLSSPGPHSASLAPPASTPDSGTQPGPAPTTSARTPADDPGDGSGTAPDTPPTSSAPASPPAPPSSPPAPTPEPSAPDGTKPPANGLCVTAVPPRLRLCLVSSD